jgi:hypothetical protein
MFRRILSELYQDSPKHNVEKALQRFGILEPPKRPEPAQNKVLDAVLKSKALPDLLAHAVRRLPERQILFAGDPLLHEPAISKLRNSDKEPSSVTFSWETNPDTLPADLDRVVLTLLPSTEAEWHRVSLLRQRYGAKLTLIFELLLPFTRISHLYESEDFLVQSFEELMEYYLGMKPFAGVRELVEAVPLAGKNVIEFGPFDGYQTAGLVHAGVGQLTCIEARPENAIKVEAVAKVFGWSNVQVQMDDFHNAHATTYGRFDLVVAHGVYYHSVAPFLFLENLRTLSDVLYVGGFCATDDLPASPYLDLHHEGRTYRAKQYREASNHTAGVNRHGYYFTSEDLIRFFTDRGDKVRVLSEQPSPKYAGKYLRILVTRS